MTAQPSPKDRTKLLIVVGFLSVFSLMMLVTWLSMSTLQDVNSGMSNLIAATSQKTSQAYQMRDVIRLRSGAVRSLFQTDDPAERHEIFAQLINYTQEYQESRSRLASLGHNPREQVILTAINNADFRVSKSYEMANEQVYSPQQNMPELKRVLHELQQHEMVLLDYLNDLVSLEKMLANEALEQNSLAYQRTQELQTYIVFAAFLLAMVISIVVITRVAKANKKIAHLANHDDLTGLHNRRSFEQHLQFTIDMANRGESEHGLIYIDLDRFKIVNDTCGHHAGDQLLIQVTELMNSRLRGDDIFARLGGDEFAIIAKAHQFNDVIALANDLRTLISDFIFTYEEQTFKVSLSIGVTPIDGKVLNMESVLADVDSACYVAKESGRNRVHVTQDDDTELVQYRNNLAGIQAIRKALDEDRLALHYQPIFHIEENTIRLAQCEILLRIRSENGELYSPTRFIPIAEKYNVMTEVDQWVFTHVIEWLATHQNERVIPKLLVNISGSSFADDSFSQFIVDRLTLGDVDPSYIAFEISESAAIKDYDKVSQFVERIRDLGCELALDDFGSGFSSFAYLKQLAFDYLKIDGSLVKNITRDNVDREMVASINQIGHTVGAKTIAEFVEDDTSLNHLRQMEVDYAQGYGLRMPTSLDQLADELDKRQPGDSGHVEIVQRAYKNSANNNIGNQASDETLRKAS